MKQMKITIPQLLLFDNTTVKKKSLNDKRLCGQSMKNQFAGTQLCGSRLSGGPPPHETNEMHPSTITTKKCRTHAKNLEKMGVEGVLHTKILFHLKVY